MPVKNTADMIITVGYGTWAATSRPDIDKNSTVVCGLTGKHEVSQVDENYVWEKQATQFVELEGLLVFCFSFFPIG